MIWLLLIPFGLLFIWGLFWAHHELMEMFGIQFGGFCPYCIIKYKWFGGLK